MERAGSLSAWVLPAPLRAHCCPQGVCSPGTLGCPPPLGREGGVLVLDMHFPQPPAFAFLLQQTGLSS